MKTRKVNDKGVQLQRDDLKAWNEHYKKQAADWMETHDKLKDSHDELLEAIKTAYTRLTDAMQNDSWEGVRSARAELSEALAKAEGK